jgi:CheY-like chemotaxis protein
VTRNYVLVVEDDSDVRVLMADLLRGRGYDVEEVADGAAALAVMRTAAPRLVLLDLVLPGDVDGWAVLDHIKADPALQGTAVCVVAGSLEKLPPGTLALKKPVPFSDLRQVVERFVTPTDVT